MPTRGLFDLQLKIDTVPRETGDAVPERVPDMRRRAQDLPASPAAQALLAELPTDEKGRARTISVAGTPAAMRHAAEVTSEDVREAAGYTLPYSAGVPGNDNA